MFKQERLFSASKCVSSQLSMATTGNHDARTATGAIFFILFGRITA